MTRRPIAKSRNQAPGAALRNAWLVLLLLAVVQPSATCLEPKRLPPLLLIPTPQLVARKPGSFRFTDGMRIAVAESGCGHDRFAARQLAEAARSDLGINIEIGPASGAPCIIIGQLGRDKSVEAALGKHLLDLAGGLGEQGYALAIRSSSIVIAGGGAAGAFYGVQTLKQIIRANATGKAIPCCEIVDWPQLRYRGWQDDISRGPIPTLDFLKRQIRNMSELKLNFFTMYTEHVFKLTKHPKIAPPDGITEDEV